MEKIDIILWIVSAGFSLMFTLMLLMWHSLNSRMDKIENRMDNLEKDIQQLNTRVAVIESRLHDLSTNVSHLMWHSQLQPPREAQEE